jgi:hypothetical protein
VSLSAILFMIAAADRDPDVHRILLEKVFPHQADIVNTDDLWTLSSEGLQL